MKVTRRTAMAAAVAAMFAPTVRLRSEIDRERLLAGFLDDDEWHVMYDHSKPYHLGGWTYATDARHMAWAELCKPDEDGGTRRIPAIEEARRKLFKPQRWVDLKLPAIESLQIDPFGLCPVCGNRRVSCGEHYPSMEWIEREGESAGYDIDDNTMRDPSCEFCQGGKRRELPSVATICGMPFSYWRLLPIAAIPGVRISATEPIPIWQNQSPSRVLCFEAEGIQGLAMGLFEEAQ